MKKILKKQRLQRQQRNPDSSNKINNNSSISMKMKHFLWQRHFHHSRAWWWRQCLKWVFSKSKTFASNTLKEKTTELRLEQEELIFSPLIRTPIRAWMYLASKMTSHMLESSLRTFLKSLALKIYTTDHMLTSNTGIHRSIMRGL